MACSGDDAFDIALDTDELLQNPILGPLARGAIERVAPGLDPDEALFPLTRGPLGLPSLVPLPKLERLYFRHAPSPSPACASASCTARQHPLLHAMHAAAAMLVWKGALTALVMWACQKALPDEKLL